MMAPLSISVVMMAGNGGAPGSNESNENSPTKTPSKTLTREEIAQRADDALQPLKEQFPDAKVGFRGSLARGTKGPHKGNAPFDSSNFDVDAFVVSDDLAKLVPQNAKRFRNLSRVEGYRKVVNDIGRQMKNIPGYRTKDVFKVRVFSEKEFAAKVAANERHLLK